MTVLMRMIVNNPLKAAGAVFALGFILGAAVL